MSDASSVQVNFGRPIPVFPLEGVVLLPQQVVHLHIHEPRYQQMIGDVLDGSGQIAMAVFAGDDWKKEYHGRPRIKRAVCLGQIAQHEALSEGRYNILLQGVCRARITKELEPEEGRLYRMAMIDPVGLEADSEIKLAGVRHRLHELLSEGPLAKARIAPQVVEYLRKQDVPTSALLEIVSFTILSEPITGPGIKYKLLAEGDSGARARLIMTHLGELSRLIERASAQHPEKWPKGVSWN